MRFNAVIALIVLGVCLMVLSALALVVFLAFVPLAIIAAGLYVFGCFACSFARGFIRRARIIETARQVRQRAPWDDEERKIHRAIDNLLKNPKTAVDAETNRN